MKELGRKKVTLWFSAEEVRLIEAAARRAYKKTATWVREKAFHAAEESDREARRRAKTEEVP